MGSLTQHRFYKPSFRRHELKRVKEEDWITVPNTHEAIIDEEQFKRVQNLVTGNFRIGKERPKELLQGLFVCHDCKKKMAMDKKEHIGKDGKLYKQYYVKCGTYYRSKTFRFCTSHCINYFDAEEAILNQIEKYCKDYLKMIKYDK